MNKFHTVIQELGSSIGIDALNFNDNNVIRLEIESMGSLYCEVTGDYLLVYLSKALQYPSLKTYQKALLLCHYFEKARFPIHVGLSKEDHLIFLIRLNFEECTFPNINECIDLLDSMHRRVLE